MRGVILALMPLLVLLLASPAVAQLVACPTSWPAEHAPWNYTLAPRLSNGVTIIDAVMATPSRLIVSLSNATLLLYDVNASSPATLEAKLASKLYLREPVHLVSVAPGLVAGVGSIASAGSSIANMLALLAPCGPGCINAWSFAALDSGIVLVYKPPLHNYVAVVTESGSLYNVSVTHPNVINNVVHLEPLGSIVEGAEPLLWCGEVHYGYMVWWGGGNGTIGVYDYAGRLVWNATGYRPLAAYYDPVIPAVVAAAVDQQGVLHVLVFTPYSHTPADIRVGIQAKKALIVEGEHRFSLIVYTEAPSPRLLRLDFGVDPGGVVLGYRLVWSIPLPGRVLLLRFLGGSPCAPRYILAATVDKNGLVTLHLIRVTDGRILWNLLTGITADQASTLHYSSGWLTAVADQAIILVNVDALARPLYAVPIGVTIEAPNGTLRYVPFNATLTCIAGSCRGLNYTVSVQQPRSTVVLLPPGVYRVLYASPAAGIVRATLTVLGRGACSWHMPDPGAVVTVKLRRLTICAYSVGDPYGWGFGRGPVPNATVKVTSPFGYHAFTYTNASGCAALLAPPGNYTIMVAARGYIPTYTRVDLVNDTTVKLWLRPICARVRIDVVAADLRRPLPNATIIVTSPSCKACIARVQPGTWILLPPGNYTIYAEAKYYRRVVVNLAVPPLNRSISLEKKLVLQPALYTTLIVLELQAPLHKNATVYLSLTRVADGITQTMTLREPLPANTRTVKLPLRLAWGEYTASITVPLHKPAKVEFRVPTPKPIMVKLSVVRYRLVVETIDAAVGRPVTVKVVASTVGYKTSFTSGTPVELPIGNYTLTIRAPYYHPVTRKINLVSDTTVRITLQPILYTVQVEVYLGRKKLANTTVTVTGRAFDGLFVNKTLVTGKDGTAIVRLVAGNYTFTAYYPVRSMLMHVVVKGVKRVFISHPTTVRIEVPNTPIIILVHLLPYLVIAIIAVIVIAIFIAMRRVIKERIRKLREALAEKLGRAPEEYGEELEDIF